MLFFYGTGSSAAGHYPLPGVACVNCGTTGSVSVVVTSRYFHFFWLPIFPYTKRAVSVCAHCKQVLDAGQWPPSYQAAGFAARNQAKAPLSNYLGLGLLGLLAVPLVGLIGYGAYLSATEKKPLAAAPSLKSELLADPRPGDQYAVFNNGNHRYGIMVVDRAGPDTVYIRTSTWMPASADALRAHPDSVRQNLNTFVVPMPRTTLDALSHNADLTVLRP